MILASLRSLCLPGDIDGESNERGQFAISHVARDRALAPEHQAPGAGHTEAVAGLPRFVVQVHDATTLHFEFRLQAGEVLRSWAVPKGPSLDPGVRRLAVPVADHDLAAGEFEGVREGQSRGSGAVIIWDEGTAEILREEPGHVSFVLHGRKLSGGFALTRTGERRWVLVKTRDEAAPSRDGHRGGTPGQRAERPYLAGTARPVAPPPAASAS